jgi:hypothetical protein
MSQKKVRHHRKSNKFFQEEKEKGQRERERELPEEKVGQHLIQEEE